MNVNMLPQQKKSVYKTLLLTSCSWITLNSGTAEKGGGRGGMCPQYS